MMREFSSSKAKTLVLVGRTGNGKSALGNSILGRKIFKSKTSAGGVTHMCELQRTIKSNGSVINVIDTPGLYDGTHSASKEIVKCIEMAKDGIHAILMVFSVKTRFSEEEYSTFLALQALFGHKIIDYMIVVFTGGDELEENEETLEDYIGYECPQPLKDILTLCGNRKVLFDNKTKNKEKQLQQVEELLKLVNIVISHNGGQPFTNELFKELKEKAIMQENQHKKIDSLEGYSKEEMVGIKMQLQQKYDDEMKRMTERVESKLKEETANLMKMLEEERVARLKAEENYKSFKFKSNGEIRRLKQDLVEANRRRNTLPFPFNLLNIFCDRQRPIQPICHIL